MGSMCSESGFSRFQTLVRFLKPADFQLFPSYSSIEACMSIVAFVISPDITSVTPIAILYSTRA